MKRLAVALACAACPTGLAAQADCFPGPHSNEAKTLAMLSVPLAFGPAGAPRHIRPGRVEVGFEAALLPNVDSATATPAICRPGKGPEHTNLLPGFVRPRLTVGLPGGLALEASWLPPVRVSGVRAHLLSAALSHAIALAPAWTAATRAHATLGLVRAPVTCPDRALAEPSSECFGGSRSDDEFRPNLFGVDAALGWRPAGGRVGVHGGGGYTRLQPRFRVNFTNSQGSIDRRRVEVDLDRLALFAGVTWAPSPSLAFAGEWYSTPADASTLRTSIRVNP